LFKLIYIHGFACPNLKFKGRYFDPTKKKQYKRILLRIFFDQKRITTDDQKKKKFLSQKVAKKEVRRDKGAKHIKKSC
jgi:hypothetical protein